MHALITFWGSKYVTNKSLHQVFGGERPNFQEKKKVIIPHFLSEKQQDFKKTTEPMDILCLTSNTDLGRSRFV